MTGAAAGVAPGSQASGTAPPGWIVLGALGALATALFVIRLTGLPNLMDNEYRLGATVLDVLQHGHWLCPQDSFGNTDKPPLLTWLSALASLAVGAVNRFTLYLPTALATLALSWIVFLSGRQHFGWRAGLLGGLAYLLSDVGAKQMATARWDGLFALTVAVTALAGFRAWMQGRGWAWFWLAAAVATLTKGPLGVLLAGLGLCATLWERRSGTPWPIRGRQVGGLILFLSLTLGWFLLAYRQVGWHLVDDMIGQELVGHVVEHAPGRKLFKPIGDYLGNFAPWSLFAIVGIVRTLRTPSPQATVRRFERFLVCWCIGGVLLFSLSPHNPARLLWPVVFPAAVLAGRELGRLTEAFRPRTLALGCVAVSAVACTFFVLEYHRLERKNPEVQATLAIQELATTVRRTLGDDPPLVHVDSPFAVQLSLNTMRPAISFDEAASLLRGGAPVLLVVLNLQRLEKVMGPDTAHLHDLLHVTVAGKPYIHVVSNREGWGGLPPGAAEPPPI